MAEIKIEKKKPVWPWILLGLIILAVILYFVFADNDRENTNMEEDNMEQVDTTYQNQSSTMNTTTGSNDVSQYLNHVSDSTRMGVDHEYTNNALTHLITAIESKAQEENVNLDVEIQEIKDAAREITEDPQATDHADQIKDAGSRIVDALEKIQTEKFPNLSQDVEEVRTAVEDIDPSTLTLEQKQSINSFFKEAADVLRNMS